MNTKKKKLSNVEVKSCDPKIKRLDVIINLLLEQSRVQNKQLTVREQIGRLGSLGLSDNEIARILGRSRGYVSSELSLLKKFQNKKQVEE